jgi:hypothetical protein
MYVVIDDAKSLGDVQVRDPRLALTVLRRLEKQITAVGWDNDMGYGWENEGRNLMKAWLQDCKNSNRFPIVYILTGNNIAEKEMKLTLQDYGYEYRENEGWFHP